MNKDLIWMGSGVAVGLLLLAAFYGIAHLANTLMQ